jgi:hypothetical protein
MKYFLLLFSLALSSLAIAQPEATMLTLTGVPQHTNYNPAFIPNYKFVFSVGAPSVHAHYSNSSFSYSDFAVKKNDSLVFDLNRFQNSLKEKNYITTAADIEVFRLGIKLNPRMYFNWFVTSKMYNRQMIPKSLTSLFIDGTSGLVGNSVSVSPASETMAYLESAFGLSYLVNNKLTLGGRVKLLSGIANATTENSDIKIAVDANYAISANATIDAKTSGIQNRDNIDWQKDYRNFFDNRGVAVDLGATFKLNNKVTLGASVLDLGSITWKNDTYAYTLDPAIATYTFEGIDFQKLLDGAEDYLGAEQDSIKSNFEMQEGKIGKYRTPLPGKMYLTASYQWKKKITFSGLLFMEQFRGRFFPGLSASAHKELGRIAGVSLSYTAVGGGFGNLGAGFNLNLSPFQFYLVGDNLLRMPLSYLANGDYSTFAANVRYFNIRAGMNFVFGRDRSSEKKTYNQRKK